VGRERGKQAGAEMDWVRSAIGRHHDLRASTNQQHVTVFNPGGRKTGCSKSELRGRLRWGGRFYSSGFHSHGDQIFFAATQQGKPGVPPGRAREPGMDQNDARPAGKIGPRLRGVWRGATGRVSDSDKSRPCSQGRVSEGTGRSTPSSVGDIHRTNPPILRKVGETAGKYWLFWMEEGKEAFRPPRRQLPRQLSRCGWAWGPPGDIAVARTGQSARGA